MIDHFATTHDALGALLAELAPVLWARPTVCPDWDVAGVVRHVVTGDRAFLVSLGGVRYDLAAVSAEVADIADDGLLDAFEEVSAVLGPALRRADPAATFPTGIGLLTAEAITELRSLEAAVHGWDVATAADVELPLDGEVAEFLIGAAHRLIASLPADRAPFGPPVAVSPDAPALLRLVALLGRRAV